MHPMQYLSKESLSEVWETKGVAEIAAQFGVRKKAIYDWAKLWNLPKRGTKEQLGPRPDDPTELEISERAAEVRARWSPQEEKKRLVGVAKKSRGWKPPVIERGEIEAPSFSRI
jgi:transposase